MLSSFRELHVWQRGMDLVVMVYRLREKFPKTEAYGLTAQLRRAAVSIPSNIAEGHTRESTKEYLHHLSMAQASLAEVQTQLEIAGRLRYVTEQQIGRLIEQCVALSKQLFALRNSLLRTQPLTPMPQ